jgi:hypothetical protein
MDYRDRWTRVWRGSFSNANTGVEADSSYKNARWETILRHRQRGASDQQRSDDRLACTTSNAARRVGGSAYDGTWSVAIYTLHGTCSSVREAA